MNEHQYRVYPRILVEECFSVTVGDLQKKLGRKSILEAVRDAKPVQFQVNGKWHSVFLFAETHRLPGRLVRWSDPDRGDARLSLICLGCGKPKRKLYCLPDSEKGHSLSDIRCRECHDLVYQSQNCGGNLWWRKAAMPLKRLCGQRRRLLSGPKSAKSLSRLDEIDQNIWLFRRRAAAKSGSRQAISQADRQKRPYRCISLIQ
jgi:hypothetical protein